MSLPRLNFEFKANEALTCREADPVRYSALHREEKYFFNEYP
jgi:hypothetical protein